MASSFTDLFWNPTVHRSELKGVAKTIVQSHRRQASRSARLGQDVEELQRQSAYLALVLGALLEELDTRAAENAGAPVAGFDIQRQRESVAPESAAPREPDAPVVRRRRR